jgi:anti-anti-sigma factor
MTMAQLRTGLPQYVAKTVVELQQIDDRLVLNCRGELDVDSEVKLARELAALATGARASVIVDLREVEFLDLRSLRLIAVSAEQLSKQATSLELRVDGGQPERLLWQSGFDKKLRVRR